MHHNPMPCQYQCKKNNDFIKKIQPNCSFWRYLIYKTYFFKTFSKFYFRRKKYQLKNMWLFMIKMWPPDVCVNL